MKKNDDTIHRPVPLPVDQGMRTIARRLRLESTPEEKKLWYQFLRTYRIRCNRQYPIAHYIVDFYCRRAALVIELDGSQHHTEEAEAKDAARTAYLNRLGLQVIRFTNKEIKTEFTAVCTAIDRAIQERIQHPERQVTFLDL